MGLILTKFGIYYFTLAIGHFLTESSPEMTIKLTETLVTNGIFYGQSETIDLKKKSPPHAPFVHEADLCENIVTLYFCFCEFSILVFSINIPFIVSGIINWIVCRYVI